jgi:hypothetical protein
VSDAFAYLSVLVSVVVGLGMSHLLSAAVRLIRHRRTERIYWPSALWGINLFLLLALVWWADFGLTKHDAWTFATFLSTLSVPACVYIACGLLFPDDPGAGSRDAYYANREWMLGSVVLAIALSFVQTYLLDGWIKIDADQRAQSPRARSDAGVDRFARRDRATRARALQSRVGHLLRGHAVRDAPHPPIRSRAPVAAGALDLEI